MLLVVFDVLDVIKSAFRVSPAMVTLLPLHLANAVCLIGLVWAWTHILANEVGTLCFVLLPAPLHVLGRKKSLHFSLI